MFRSKTVAPSSATVTKGVERLSETWDTARTTLRHSALAPHMEAARDAVAPRLAAARIAVAPYVEEAGARVTPVIERVTPVVETAVERFAPTVESAVETARTRLRDDVVPVVTAAVESARESSAPARAEAKERAANALHALQGRQQRARRWPVALGCLAAGAVAGAAASVLTRRQSTPVTPRPFPAPVPAAVDDTAQTNDNDTNDTNDTQEKVAPSSATQPGSSTG